MILRSGAAPKVGGDKAPEQVSVALDGRGAQRTSAREARRQPVFGERAEANLAAAGIDDEAGELVTLDPALVALCVGPTPECPHAGRAVDPEADVVAGPVPCVAPRDAGHQPRCGAIVETKLANDPSLPAARGSCRRRMIDGMSEVGAVAHIAVHHPTGRKGQERARAEGFEAVSASATRIAAATT